MKAKFDTREYKILKDKLKQKYEAEKTGDQTLYIDQERLFKPLIENQEKTSKATQDKIVASQEANSNALVPIANDIQKRIDQIEALQELPFYSTPPGIEDVPQSTPQKVKTTMIDLNARLNTTDFENLEDMQLLKPNEVREDGNINDVLRRIEKYNRSNAQYLSARSKKTDVEKQVFQSRKETLEKYKQTILDIRNNEVYVKSGKGLRKHKPFKLKRGRGRPKMYPDTIMYNNSQDLRDKLFELLAAKKAGNTGLDTIIVTALDELFNKKWITKDQYDDLFENIFPDII